MPDRGGHGEDALSDSNADAGVGLAAVAFEVELALERGVDGLDDLAQCLKNRCPGRGFSHSIPSSQNSRPVPPCRP